MSAAASDRNLLFGILAVQMNFIGRDALIQAMHAWVLEKNRPLGEILVRQSQMTSDRQELLEALVAEHLKVHNDDPQQSLAALSTIHELIDSLGQIADGDLQQSMSCLHAASALSTQTYFDRNAGARYRIVRPHAHGGLGEVFVAEDTELHRQVALKEIQTRHADNPNSRGRFLLEAEVTGGLEHPGIVPVYGLGTYADGRPFYAMRFIRGDSLKEAIQRFHRDADCGLPLEETSSADAARAQAAIHNSQSAFASIAFRKLLHRFIDVCNAIAYAHSRGILHRDLKPSNIMLGKYGETLVVDWGLAKPLGSAAKREHPDYDTDERTLQPNSGSGYAETQMGAAVGTPPFMSPEQASGRLDQLGPAADIYSLGATLYAVLTGRAPISGIDVATILRKAQSGDFPPPRAWNSAIPKALDAICRRAMAHRREDRYSTATALAEEIERFLADEPVSAYREPWPSRAKRWMRKHPTAIGASAALLITSLIALGAGLYFVNAERNRTELARREAVAAQRAESSQRQRADVQKQLADLARGEAEEAQQKTMAALRAATDEVVERLIGAKPVLGPSERAYLQSALERWQTFAAEQGDSSQARSMRAEGALNVASLQARLGLRDEAMTGYRESILLHEKLVAELPAIHAYRRNLGKSHNNLGTLLRDFGKRALAEEHHSKALAIQEQLAAELPAEPAYLQDLATSHLNLGNLFADLGKHIDDELHLQKALAIQQQLAADFPALPTIRQDLALSHNNLGARFMKLAKHVEAAEQFSKALDIRQQLTTDFPDVPEFREELAASQNSFGVLFKNLGKRVEAEVYYSKALAIQQELAAQFPAVLKYRQELAASRTNLGNLLASLGKRLEAEQQHQKSLAILAQLTVDFPNVPAYRQGFTGSLERLGTLLMEAGKHVEAEEQFIKDLIHNEQLVAEFPGVPEYRQDLAASRVNLASLLDGRGKRVEAEEHYSKALAIHEQLVAEFPVVPIYGLNLAVCHDKLGSLLSSIGKRVEAEMQYRNALQIREKLAADFPAFPDYRHYSASSHHNLAFLLDQLEKRVEAREHYTQALAIHERLVAEFPTVPAYRQNLARHYHNLGLLLENLGQRVEAEEQYRKALAVKEQLAAEFPAVPAYRRDLALSHNNLGIVLMHLGKPDEADEQNAVALTILERLAAEFPAIPAYQVDLGGSYCNFGNKLRMAGKPAESLPWYEKAQATLEKVVREEPRDPTARAFLRNSFQARAMAYERLRNYAAATNDWNQVVELSPPPEQPINRAWRAMSRHNAGQVADAFAEVAELTAPGRIEKGYATWPPGHWFNFALVYADASGKFAEKKQEYADRAMELLQNAVKAGFNEPAYLRRNPNFEVLRDREDYKNLLTELEAAKAKSP